jgi:hypothetical protein
MPFKPGDLVYVFKFGRHTEKNLGMIIKAEYPPPGSLQIPQIEALVNGETIKISFEEVRKVEDCIEDGQKEEVLEEEETPNREIGTLASIDSDMFHDDVDDSVVLIMDVCPDSEACKYFEQGPLGLVNHCYVHSETGLEWTDYMGDGTLLARVLHPVQGQVWIPQAWLVPVRLASQ